MPRPESLLREGDKMSATRQRIQNGGAPLWSIVVSICPDIVEVDNEFIIVDYPSLVGWYSNPSLVARQWRYTIDNLSMGVNE